MVETEVATQPGLKETIKERRVKLQTYTPTEILTGYAYCSPRQRLLDLLNGVLAGPPRPDEEFLPISEVGVRSLDGKEATLQYAYINKASILFVRERDNGQSRGLGGKLGHKPYPFAPKLSTVVKIHILSYTLTGQMHYAKGERVVDILNSGLRFLPLTNVNVEVSSRSTEPRVSFIAVNRKQILSLEEVDREQFVKLFCQQCRDSGICVKDSKTISICQQLIDNGTWDIAFGKRED